MKVNDYLSSEEIRSLTQRSDVRGGMMLAGNWLAIALIFYIVATWTNPLTIILTIYFLGGQQLGLAVLQHEAGHKTLFATSALNDSLGQWLASYLILGDCKAYGASHREHHRLAGTHDDPDLPNYESYPISAKSLRRKIWRDISGQTGSKQLLGLLRGVGNRSMMRDGEGTDAILNGLIANGALLAVLWLTGNPALYLLWVAAYIFALPLYARVRQVAEHANVPGLYESDPRGNTRTIQANLIERAFLCPHNVNLHIEHHLLPSVPAWKLKRLHALLMQRGFYDEHPEAIVTGYRDMLHRVVPELNRSAAVA